MMHKLRHWLRKRFLEVWIKEDLLRENDRLQAQVKELEAELRRRGAYLNGLNAGIRAQRRIVIHNNGGEK
ncbi:MAG: hypothetical protein IJY28_04865 [Clostridia bacterium]|nr:hypothetical protein [Clostridia bacterium]